VSDLGFLERADLGDLGRDDEGNTVLHLLVPFLPGDHLRAILHHWRQINAANHAGQSALHLAVRHSRLNVVLALLEHGADPNSRNAAGSTSLHCAICHVTGGNRFLADMVAALTAAGADGSLRDRSGNTPGFYAARLGHSAEFVRIFDARPVPWQERFYF
jgi:ankyrin repeat protein